MTPGFRPSAIRIHPDVDEAYAALEEAAQGGEKPQQGMWARFQAALGMIRQDGQWGEVIRSDRIPKYFAKVYGVTNLYCIDLKGDVRAFYTIDQREVLFLDIVDHKTYDKWFPPKGQRRRRA